MTDNILTVNGTPSNPAYTQVATNGTIFVRPGATSILFVCGPGLSFQPPWITFEPTPPPGTFTIKEPSSGQFTLVDVDSGGKQTTYEYTLYTTAGPFDPEVINTPSG